MDLLPNALQNQEIYSQMIQSVLKLKLVNHHEHSTNQSSSLVVCKIHILQCSTWDYNNGQWTSQKSNHCHGLKIHKMHRIEECLPGEKRSI